MIDKKEIIRRLSVEEIAAHRNRALEEFQRGIGAMANACAAWTRAAPGKTGPTGKVLPYDIRGDARTLEAFRRELDADVWRHVIRITGLASLMDATARDEFEKGLENPVPVTAENVTATVFTKIGEAGAIFRRGLVKAFETLDDYHNKRFKTNDRFKLGDGIKVDRVIVVDKAFTRWTWREATIRDCDRTMFVLNGKMFPLEHNHPDTLIQSINDAIFADRAGPWEGKTPYWRWKLFKNGALHLRFARLDLRDAANRVIAAHYGDALADATPRH